MTGTAARQPGADAIAKSIEAIHPFTPYITGAPHRIGYLEKLLQPIRTHEDIALSQGSRSWIGTKLRQGTD